MLKAWKIRDRRLGWARLSDLKFLSAFMGLVLAGPLLVLVFQAAGQSAHNVRATAATHWRAETAIVASRGPYAGDAAYVSYRLVGVGFRDWNGHPKTIERLVSWDTSVGQRLPVTVGDHGGIYLPADLNNETSNPLAPDTTWKWCIGGLPWFLLYGVAAGILDFIAYFLIVVIRVKRPLPKNQAVMA